MFKRIHPILATAACALALSVLTAPPASAEVLATGRATNSPFVVVWVDNDKGTKYDAKASKEFKAQFAGSDWSISDEGVIINKGEKLLAQGSFVGPDDGSWAQFHGRAGNAIVTGLMVRFEDDPTQGVGRLVLTESAAEGKSSRSIFVETLLLFDEEGGGDGA